MTAQPINASELNDLAMTYYIANKLDEPCAEELRSELWGSSYRYLCWINRNNYKEKDHYDPRNAWDVTDAIGESAKYLPNWIELFNPEEGSWVNYLSRQVEAVRTREVRPKNFGHRVYEACVRVLELMRKGADETTALRAVMDESSSGMKQQIRECFEQMRSKNVSLSTPLDSEGDGDGGTISDLLDDEHSLDAVTQLIDRTSRAPILRKLHNKHADLIEQLSDGVSFTRLEFGEPLSLPAKAIRLSEALSRARQAYVESLDEESRIAKLRLTPIPGLPTIASVTGKDSSNYEHATSDCRARFRSSA